MAILEMLSWWYLNGWGVFIAKVKNFLKNISNFFSMDSLLRTLFQPYRQISAETAHGNSSLDLKFQMFVDRSISRVVGFFSRLILLIVGIVIMLVGSVVGLVFIIAWPVIPFLPIVGVVLSAAGVML